MKRANIITIDNRVKYQRLILMLRPELRSMNCGLKRDERSNIYKRIERLKFDIKSG